MKKISLKSIFLLSLIILLFGCSREVKITSDISEAFDISEVDLNLFEDEIVIDYSANHEHFVYVTLRNENDKKIRNMYYANMNHLSENTLLYTTDSSGIILLDVDDSGNSYILRAAEMDAASYELLMYDNKGTLYKEDSIEVNFPTSIKVADNENLFIMTMDALSLYCINDQTNEILLDEVALLDITRTNRKDCMTAFLNADGELILSQVNLDSKKSEEIGRLPADKSMLQEFVHGADDTIYYCDQAGIWSYHQEENEIKKEVDFSDCSLSKSTISKITFIDSSTFYYIDSNSPNGNGTGLYKLYKISEKEEKETLNLRGIDIPNVIKRAVFTFNHTNTKYRIELVDYGQYGESAINKLNTDLMEKGGTDLLSLNRINIYDYLQKEILLDLNEYLEKDAELNREDIVPSVLTCLDKNGKIYYISPGFVLHTGLTTVDDFKEEILNRSTLLSFLENTSPENPVSNLKKQQLFLNFCVNNLSSADALEDIVLLKNKDKVKEYLLMSNEMGREETMTVDQIAEESPLISSVTIMDMNDFLLYKRMFKEEVKFVGEVVEEGNGNRLDCMGMDIGIIAASQNKEAAWEFIKVLLDETFQYNTIYPDYFPTNARCMERILNIVMCKEEYKDEAGNEIRPYSCEVVYDGYETIIDAMTEQEKEAFQELLYATMKEYKYDFDLLAVFLQEADVYFKGNDNINQVVDSIMKRSKLILDEKKFHF